MTEQLDREYRTQRLLLRPFTSADVDADFAYASSPSYGEFLNLPQPFERRHSEERIARCLNDDWSKEPSFAIVLDGSVIGTLSVRIDNANWANLGYGLSYGHWGKGLIVEAARPIITDLFRRIHVARIEISADAPNHRSRRVAEKLGFHYEGTLRNRMIVRNQRYDDVYYGLLPNEWNG